MSRIKNPQEKKLLSLENDRRNTYGENKKSSRKNIPRSKRLTQQALRRSLAVAVQEIERSPSEDAIDAAESKARVKMLRGTRAKFKKIPDAPLGAVLERKKVTNRSSYKAMGPQQLIKQTERADSVLSWLRYGETSCLPVG